MKYQPRQTILVLVVCLLFILYLGYKQQPQALRLSEPIQRSTIVDSVYGIGTVVANQSFHFKTSVPNTIQTLYVREGDSVMKGQKLIDFLGANTLVAPFDGTVTFLPVKAKENILANTEVLNLVDLRDRYMQVSLEQRGVLRVRRGQSAHINFDSLRKLTFHGEVKSIYSNDNNFFVRIDIPNLPLEVLPGMTGDVAIVIKTHLNALLIPVAAIDHGCVTIERDGKRIVAVPIKIGLMDGDVAEVLSGDIHVGDQLYLNQVKRPS